MELGVSGGLLGFHDAVEGSGFSFFGNEDGSEGVGAFGECGCEGNDGVFFTDRLGGDFLAVDTEGGGGHLERDSIVSAEGFGGSGDIFTWRK